jgi:hypothetical protein
VKSTAAHAHATATVTKRLHAEHDDNDDDNENVLTGSRSVFDISLVIMGVYGMYGPHVENVICATSTSASALAFAVGV